MSLKLFILGVAACAFSLHSHAAPIVIGEQVESVNIGKVAEFLEDKDLTLRIDDVHSEAFQNRFEAAQKENPDFGITNSAFWMRFELTSFSSEIEQRYLEIQYPMLKSIQLYAPQEDGGFIYKKAGFRLPFSQRDLDHHNFIFAFDVLPGTHFYYVRVDSAAAKFPTFLHSTTSLIKDTALKVFAPGAVFWNPFGDDCL